MIVTALAVVPAAVGSGMSALVFGRLLAGFTAGPIDVGVLTLRQRRTDPARLGRVLAVSMSVNLSGFPIGTAIGGMLAAWSPVSAFLAAALASLLAALAICWLIPENDEQVRP
jgi:MFS family permease